MLMAIITPGFSSNNFRGGAAVSFWEQGRYSAAHFKNSYDGTVYGKSGVGLAQRHKQTVLDTNCRPGNNP